MRGSIRSVVVPFVLLAQAALATAPGPADVPLANFNALYGADDAAATDALGAIEENWFDAYAGMLLDAFWFARNRVARSGIERLLARAPGRPFDEDIDPWYQW